MESDSISSVSALSDAFLSMFIFFLILLLADQFLTLIRAAVVSANFSDDLVDSSKSDRKAMTSLFTATAANLAVLDFALSCASVLTAIAGVLLTFSGLTRAAVELKFFFRHYNGRNRKKYHIKFLPIRDRRASGRRLR